MAEVGDINPIPPSWPKPPVDRVNQKKAPPDTSSRKRKDRQDSERNEDDDDESPYIDDYA